MRRSNQGRVGRTFQMAEDLSDDLTLRDGGDDPQRPPLTPRAAYHIQCKDVLQQPCPTPARRRRAVLVFPHALLAWRGDDRPTQMAVRRQKPS